MVPALDATAGGPSAQAARLMLHAVQRYVCLAQLRLLLQQATLPPAPPGLIPVPEGKTPDLREGATVELFSRLTCTVAFARGQERNVLFDIKGLPQQQGRTGVQDPDELEGLSGPPPTPAEIAAAAPVVVVADAGRPMVQGPGVPYCGPGARVYTKCVLVNMSPGCRVGAVGGAVAGCGCNGRSAARSVAARACAAASAGPAQSREGTPCALLIGECARPCADEPCWQRVEQLGTAAGGWALGACVSQPRAGVARQAVAGPAHGAASCFLL